MGRRRHLYSFSSDSDSDASSSGRKKKKKRGFLSGQPGYTRLIVNVSALAIAASAGWLLVKQFTSRSNDLMVCKGSSTGESSTDKFFECEVPAGYSLQNSVGKVPVRLDKVIKAGGFDPRLWWVLFPLLTLITVLIPGLFYYLVSARKLRQKEKKRKEKYKDIYKRDSRREGHREKDYTRDEPRKIRARYDDYDYDYMSDSSSDEYFTDSSLGSESDYYY